MEWLFPPPRPPPEEEIEKWRKQLQIHRRDLESENRTFDRIEAESLAIVKQYLKEGEPTSARIVLGAVLTLRKARERNLMLISQLRSVDSQLVQHKSQMQLQKVMRVSASVMQSMNALVQATPLMETTKQMALEMQRAEMMEEAMATQLNNVMDFGNDNDDLERDVDIEVNQVLEELAQKWNMPSAVFSPSKKEEKQNTENNVGKLKVTEN